MKLLPSHKISSEILDLIYEARQYLIIVSPYVNFSNWERLASELTNARKRGVRVDFFVRNEPENASSWEQVENLGFTPRLVNNLHAKFYFNERSGVISSMNLLSGSNSNSIEIGCKLESMEELAQLQRFVKDFLSPNEAKEKPDSEDLYVSKEKFTVVLENYIAYETKSRTSAYFKNGALQINACSNQFFLHVDKVENKVYLDAILGQLEADLFKAEGVKYLKPSYFECELIEGGKGYHNMIRAYSQVRLSNSFLDNLRVHEKKDLIAEITECIKGVRNLKDASYEMEKARKAKDLAAFQASKATAPD